jgi:hypothetical protein
MNKHMKSLTIYWVKFSWPNVMKIWGGDNL